VADGPFIYGRCGRRPTDKRRPYRWRSQKSVSTANAAGDRRTPARKTHISKWSGVNMFEAAGA
jgi:hypothetical protein